MFLIAGPCAIESRDIVLQTAERLKCICEDLHIPLVFKASFDKANRTSLSARGLGIETGLHILQDVKEQVQLPILTDVHECWQCNIVAAVADVIQIPAFLSRQTDLILSAAATGKIVNVKKGQFMAPWDMKGVVEKFTSVASEGEVQCGQISTKKLWLTERGVSFGYGNLVVAMTGNVKSVLVSLCEYTLPIICDKEVTLGTLVPTSSTTVALVMGDALVTCLLERRHFSPNDFLTTHPGGALKQS